MSQSLIPLQSIVVVRDNKMVSPPLGKPFPFTDDEVKDLPKGSYRSPVVEVATDAGGEEDTGSKQPAPVAKTPVKGKKPSNEDL